MSVQNMSRITEPKRLFDSTLELGENVIANTSAEKWIVSDLWINNAHYNEREVTLISAYQKDGKEIRRTLLSDVLLKEKQTMIVGNIILEPNEKVIAVSTFDSYAYRDINNMRLAARADGIAGNDIKFKFTNPQVVDSALSYTKNGNQIDFVLATSNTTVPVSATLETDLVGVNNDLVFTAKELGTQGNNISIEYIHAGISKPLTIETIVSSIDLVQNYDVAIKITLATNAGGSVTSTATQIKTLIDSSSAANKWITVEHKGADTGAGTVVVMDRTFLTGGVDATTITTYKDIHDLIKATQELDEFVDVYFLNDFDGNTVVNKLVLSSLKHGEATIYDPAVYGLTGVSIIGYGRVV